MLSTALLLVLSAHAAGESAAARAEAPVSSSSTAELAGEVCFSERDCRPYTLDLDEDGTFADSLARRGTWQPRDTGKTVDLQLSFTTGDDVVLGGGNGEPDCWADPGPSINPAIGQINVCMVVPHTEHNFDDQACGAAGTIQIVVPYPEEDGHWSAGRVTPTVPMWVTSVEYHLNHTTQDVDASCGQVAHSYEVFLGAANLPPDATPTPITSGYVSVAELGPVNSHIEIELDEPVWLDTGDSLFVSVEMLWDGDVQVCRFTCPSTFEPGLGYWSYAVDTPYSWGDLFLDGVSVPMVTAYGLRLWP